MPDAVRSSGLEPPAVALPLRSAAEGVEPAVTGHPPRPCGRVSSRVGRAGRRDFHPAFQFFRPCIGRCQPLEDHPPSTVFRENPEKPMITILLGKNLFPHRQPWQRKRDARVILGATAWSNNPHSSRAKLIFSNQRSRGAGGGSSPPPALQNFQSILIT